MKCNNCGATLESNSLKCKCGAEIINGNEKQLISIKSLWENILNFLSEEKHFISFLLVFSEVFLMIYGFIIGFYFDNMFLYLFFAFIIFSFLSTPFLIAKGIDENSSNIGEINFYYIFGLIFNILFVLFLFFYGTKEINSNEYNLLPKNYIQTELDDNKITYFEAFKILYRKYENLLETNKEINNQELKQKELTKKKILKEIIENKSQQKVQ